MNTSVTTGGDGSAGNAYDSEFWINAEKFKFTNSTQSGSVTAFSIDASGTTPVIAFNGTVTIGSPIYQAIEEKSHVFSNTPTAPYNIGDFWNISTGVLTATVARSASESYTLSDWSLLSTKNVFKGAWATLTAYSPGDIVTNAGQSYSNLVGVSSSNTSAPVVGSTWALYAAKGDKGDDGDSYTGTTEYYKLTNSTTAPTIASGSWLTSPQNPTSSNQYLWNFNRNTRSIGSDIDSPVSLVTQYVADGRGISSITELYAKSSSATTSPTVWGTYASSLPLSDAEPYLWNKTTTNYTVGAATSTSTIIAIKGTDADALTVTTSTSNGVTTLTFSDGSTAIVNDGTSPAASGITIIYASDAAGTTTSFTQGTHRYANYFEWTGTAPTSVPAGLVYTLFIGVDGDHAGVMPVYADDAAGTGASLTDDTKAVSYTHLRAHET